MSSECTEISYQDILVAEEDGSGIDRAYTDTARECTTFVLPETPPPGQVELIMTIVGFAGFVVLAAFLA